MKKRVLLVAAIAFSMVCLSAQNTRGRQNTGNKPGTTTTNTSANKAATRPGTSTAPSVSNNSASQRPGTPNGRPANNGNNNQPNKPNNPGPNGGFNPGTNRPNNPPQPPQPQRPPQPQKPPQPAPPKPTGYHPGYNYRPPMHYTPPTYRYTRPTPPSNWRLTYNSPNFGTILGITLGSIISNSVNTLINSGYNVAGYNRNEVYLNNVNYCNVNWPNATMFYNNGYLQGSLFSASTISYDQSRYNYVYSYLTSLYGMPVSIQNLSGGGLTCTWWGYNNTYLTLSYYPEYVNGIGYRYFTTLATGN